MKRDVISAVNDIYHTYHFLWLRKVQISSKIIIFSFYSYHSFIDVLRFLKRLAWA
jgi:hypothetical protein